MYPYNYTLIIPHYNIHNLLRRLLRTIPVRNDLQVIVVDDCSTQGLDEYERIKLEFPNVEFYSTEINGGGGKARNIGLRNAKGRYLIFSDSDDFFNLCFEEALDKYADSNFDLIYFAANSVDTVSFQSANRDCAITPLVNKYLKTGNDGDIKQKFTAPWCKFISKKLVYDNKIAFQESDVYNDMHFSQLVDFYAKNISADSLAIYCVTDRLQSVSAVTNPDKEVKKMAVVADYYKFALDNDIAAYPLWRLIGPMMEVFRKNKWQEYQEKAIKHFTDLGIRRSIVYKNYLIYKLFKKVLIPGREILFSVKYILTGA